MTNLKNKECKECCCVFLAKSLKAVYCGKKCAHKSWRKNNRQRASKLDRAWRSKNKDIFNAQKREKTREYNRIYWAKRRQQDLNFKLRNNLRTRINSALKQERSFSIEESVGCSIEELKQHLESMFSPGMTWKNHTKYGWHIDHVLPLSSFDLSKEEEYKAACHYTNLQPLWWQDNLKKG